MSKWKPDKTIEIPMYKQIVDYIKSKLASGEWPVGMRLKSQRELSEAYGVNRSTIVEAIDVLKSEGLIEGQGRRGTVVINNSWSLMASNPPPNWEKYIQSGMHWSNQSTIQAINKLEFEPNMIRLGTGELSPELYPKEEMAEVMCQVGRSVSHLGYEAPKGSLELRKALSAHLKESGIHASPENILIVSGSLQALQLISLGILHANSSVYVEKPSYLKSLNIFQSAGMQLCGVKMDEEGMSLKDLKNRVDIRKTSLVYSIPTFHNPTGGIMSINRRKELLEYCRLERLPIIEDDAYRDLWLDEKPPKPLKSMDTSGSVLYIGSISKSLAAGLRIGWLVGPQTVVDRLGDIKMQTDYGASSISQAILASWLKGGYHSKYTQWLREALKIRRSIAIETLEKHMGDIGSWTYPTGGFYIWLKLNKQLSLRRLFKKAARENILINPGQIYDFEDNQYIRLSYSYATHDELRMGIIRLAELIRDEMEN